MKLDTSTGNEPADQDETPSASDTRSSGLFSKEGRNEYQNVVVRAYRPAIIAILVIVTIYFLEWAAAIIVPCVAAVLLAFLFKPAIRRAECWNIRPIITSGLIVIALTLIVFSGVLLASDSIKSFVAELPETADAMRTRALEFANQHESMDARVRAVEDSTEESGTSWFANTFGGGFLFGPVFSQTSNVLLGLIITLVLGFFLMGMGDRLLLRVVQSLDRFEDKRHAVDAFRQIEHDISEYLLLRTLINVGLGGVSYLIFLACGLPNPVMWAFGAALFNYIPYIGPLLLGIMLVAAGVMNDAGLKSLLPAVLFGAVNTVEAYLVTPLVIGKRWRLNEALVFVWLIFWGWLWGIIGALLAVPMLICLRIVCDHVAALQPIGDLLGESNKDSENH